MQSACVLANRNHNRSWQSCVSGSGRGKVSCCPNADAEAVNYTLNQWNELGVFAAGRAVPIDNNISEREMKRIVLNRKNSLFVGNERGGQTAAILSSITSTCRRHGIDPQRYLTQLLTNLPATPISQISQWLPEHWKQRNPQQSG